MDLFFLKLKFNTCHSTFGTPSRFFKLKKKSIQTLAAIILGSIGSSKKIKTPERPWETVFKYEVLGIKVR